MSQILTLAARLTRIFIVSPSSAWETQMARSMLLPCRLGRQPSGARQQRYPSLPNLACTAPRPMTEKETSVNLQILRARTGLSHRRPLPSENTASIHDQKWLLVLTGVVTANLQGNSTSHWLNANLSFLPTWPAPATRTLELGHRPICNPEAGRPELRHRICAGRMGTVRLTQCDLRSGSIDRCRLRS